ncbi:MAG: glycosyltransferase family 2 protein [Clostridiales bacterium]|jgi:glycosyltransferase involved in cell wall biosynthesis|nr:glycosyltransferase family 2 protein [Clostridiales bacterium]
MKISCVIPAYNEEKTIGNVIECVKNAKMIDEIIVISDGSVDETANISKNLGVRTIEIKNNRGKGAALVTGIENSDGDILIFLDADLIGLNEKHIDSLLLPVINNETDMTIGLFKNGRFVTDIAQKVAPYLSGQRALKRNMIQDIDKLDLTRYGIEVALTKLAEKRHYRFHTVKLEDLTHIMKEEKLGFSKGFAERIKMYWQIIRCMLM